MVKLLTEKERETLDEKIARGGLSGWIASKRLRLDDERRLHAETVATTTAETWRGKVKLSSRGFHMPFGGPDQIVGPMPEARATTVQLAGLNPWAVGAGAPLVGTPVGLHLVTGGSVHFDLTGWMVRGGYITAPVMLLLALNGYGKSSLVRRIQTGAVAQGRTSLVLGDCKPDFRAQTEAFGGQVIELGHGHGTLNPLDVGALGRVIPVFEEEADKEDKAGNTTRAELLREKASSLRLEVRQRQLTMVAGLIELIRHGKVGDFEETVIASSLRILYEEEGFDAENPPLLQDLLEVIKSSHPTLMEDVGVDVHPTWAKADDEDYSRIALEEYSHQIQPLRRSLRALIKGEFGEIFNNQTTTRLDLDAPAICVDVSKIPHSDTSPLRAAVLMTCWSEGFGAVQAAHELADMGLAPKRTFQCIMDELWQVLGADSSMISRVNELSRLNRTIGTELIMITHSIADFGAFDSARERGQAEGLVERARVKIFGALPPKEVARLRDVVGLSATEESMLTSWAATTSLTGEGARPGEAPPLPPGTGKFLIKVGERGTPGIPFQLIFAPSERTSGVHDTNARFADAGKRAGLEKTAMTPDEGKHHR
ncbi:hypothetical protein L1O03_02895 [Corynebacterium uropygiale]|uniref:ATP/GTP-binding protein n=1 Tax=Corynebacterium uropygiale TaxID=1775911 RepID=A0A9X1TXI5_9CORY|nr:hypothetical protein [Corynebacterium uropygiale]MCF4006125.1 hypothetical protein [Corynebacterium uropygiale]